MCEAVFTRQVLVDLTPAVNRQVLADLTQRNNAKLCGGKIKVKLYITVYTIYKTADVKSTQCQIVYGDCSGPS